MAAESDYMTYTNKLIIEYATGYNYSQVCMIPQKSVKRRFQNHTGRSTFYEVPLRIYPQGLFRLKTTVKPLKGNEYDLDLLLNTSPLLYTETTLLSYL